MKKIICIFLLSLSSFAVELPPVIISAKVDKAQVTTGDLFIYTVKLDVEKKYSVTLPELGGSIASFRVVDFGKEDPIEEGGRAISSRWYQLQADLTGSYILPALEVKYKDAQGKEAIAKTSEIFVEVASVLKKEGEEGLRDIKRLQSSSRSLTPLSYILLVVFLMVVGIIVFLWFKTRNSKEILEKELLPYEVALRDLELMEKQNLDLKPYYFRLTEILKNYFEGIYKVSVTDMTLEEIIRTMAKEKTIPSDSKEKFLLIMKESELVKFSDHIPAPEVSKEMIERVRIFIKDTMPQLEESHEQESVI